MASPVFYRNALEAWVDRDGNTAPIPTTPPSPLFPGHLQGRVLWGMGTSPSTSLELPYDSAKAFTGGVTNYARRIFNGGAWPSESAIVGSVPAINQNTIISNINTMQTKDPGVFKWLSFNVPGGASGWASATGTSDANLDIIKAAANDASVTDCIFVSIDAEPLKNFGAYGGDFSAWCYLQKYISNYMEDTPKVIVAPVLDGAVFGPKFWRTSSYATYRSNLIASGLIETLKGNGHMPAISVFDNPNNGNPLSTDAEYDSGQDRASEQLSYAIEWFKHYQAPALPVSLFSGSTGVEYKRIWNLCVQNRLFIPAAIAYNSSVVSITDSGLLVPSQGFTYLFGTPRQSWKDSSTATQLKLTYWLNARTVSDSINPVELDYVFGESGP